jgi:mRNA interferase MazF
VVTTRYTPSRGDVVLVDLSPTLGHELSGERPVLVLTLKDRNRLTGLAVVCPITNDETESTFKVDLPPGSSVSGAVVADQARSIDWRRRNARFVAQMPREFVDRVALRIASLLEFLI